MSIDWQTAAQIARRAGRETIRDGMEARGRFSPWEVRESSLQASITQAFLAEARKRKDNPFRMIDELKLGEITNITYTTSPDHPVDIAVLHPLIKGDDGSCDPWHPQRHSRRAWRSPMVGGC